MKRKKREGTKEEKKRKKCFSKPEPARRPPTRVRPARCPKPSRAPFGGRARPFRCPPLRTRAHRGETRAVTGNATPPRGPPRGPGPAPLLPSPTIRAPTLKIQICWCAAGPGFFSRQKTLFSRAAGRTSDGPSPASASPTRPRCRLARLRPSNGPPLLFVSPAIAPGQNHSRPYQNLAQCRPSPTASLSPLLRPSCLLPLPSAAADAVQRRPRSSACRFLKTASFLFFFSFGASPRP